MKTPVINARTERHLQALNARKCVVVGCGRAHHAKGLCTAHYQRHKLYGDLQAEKPIGIGACQTLIDFAFRSNTDECILIKTNLEKDGYSRIVRNGQRLPQHRWVCIEAHGPPPFADAQAAHKCGVRNCINPKHVYWATAKQNCADRIGHGTSMQGERCPLAKLDDKKVRAIRQSGKSSTSLAKQYGVEAQTIRKVRTRKTWGHVDA